MILLGVCVVSFLIFNYNQLVFSILFIVAGLVLIFIGLSSRKKEKTVEPLPDEAQQEIPNE